jgi:hypothetical protein
MHKIVRWHYLGSIAISAVFVVGALAASTYLEIPTVQAATTPTIYNIGGWVWSGNTGWVSLNALNDPACISNPGSCTSYGLRLDIDETPDKKHGTLVGYAWSSALGWLCFGTTCGSSLPVPTNNEGNSSLAVRLTCFDNASPPVEANCDTAFTGELTGWARILNQGDAGWISLKGSTYATHVKFNQCWDGTNHKFVDCPEAPTPDVPDVEHRATFLSGWAWHQASGNSAALPNSTAYGAGWFDFNQQSEVLFPYLQGFGGDIYSGRGISSMFSPPSGRYNAQYLVHVGGSSISTSFASLCTDSACKAKQLSLVVPPTNAPGLTDPYSFRLGRFDFRGLYTPANCNCASASSGLPLPICSAVTRPIDCATKTVLIDKYNFPVEYVSASNPFNFSQPLGGKVYVPPVVSETDPSYSGQQVFDTASVAAGTITFKNSTTAVSAAATIIVRGNLLVSNNIAYDTGSSGGASSQLASVTWVVLGDVRVLPSVSKLAGSFIVLGQRSAQKVCDRSPSGVTCVDDSSCTDPSYSTKYCVSPDPAKADTMCTVSGECGLGGTCAVCKPKYVAHDPEGDVYDGFGKFKSCYDVTPGSIACSQAPLQVQGSVFARQFKLDRAYINVQTKEPAEQFIADGRVQLNPPPGMADFAKGLPTFTRR